MPKIILSGYDGSKKIIPASSYQWAKHTPEKDILFLNYGNYNDKLFIGEYVSLKDKQDAVNDWSKDIVRYLDSINDEYLIFGLDDFLLASYSFPDIFKTSECTNMHTEFDVSNKEYSCTAQLTLWKKGLLIEILSLVKTPWEFELWGSQYINAHNIKVEHVPLFNYCGESALSARHPGKVSIKGLSEEDIKDLIDKKLINKDELIIGQPMGKEIKYEQKRTHHNNRRKWFLGNRTYIKTSR